MSDEKPWRSTEPGDTFPCQVLGARVIDMSPGATYPIPGTGIEVHVPPGDRVWVDEHGVLHVDTTQW